MQPNAYLFFPGSCREALTAYGNVFGTTPEIMAFSDAPADVQAAMPGVATDAVMHGTLPVGGGLLFASDNLFGESAAMSGCDITVSLPDDAETRRVFEALSQGGEIRSPLEPNFWTSLYAACTDRFGIRWMVMTDSAAP